MIFLAALLAGSTASALGRAGVAGNPAPTVVQVCVQKNSGQVRLVTPQKSSCGPSESAAAWTVGGDIAAVEAGKGLTGGGADGLVRLDIDPSVVQTRVGGTCTGTTAIGSIAPDGMVTCNEGGGGVIAGFNDGPGSVEPDESAGGLLNLPAGKYAIFAKMWVSADAGGSLLGTHVSCTLKAGTNSDQTDVVIPEQDVGVDSSASMSFMVMENFTRPSAVGLGCYDFEPTSDGQFFGNAIWHDVKITAIETSNLSNAFVGN